MESTTVVYPKTSPVPAAEKPEIVDIFDFYEAMRRINNGKKITKKEWPTGWKCFLKDNTLMIQKPSSELHSWIITAGDILGRDYVEV